MHRPVILCTWHVVIAGFLQTRGTANGMIDLHRRLRQKHVSAQTVVQFCHWNDNVDGLAEQIWRTARDADVVPAVYVYAYSWGGMTAMNFARALGERGLGVRQMVLSDPVYRDRFWIRRYTRAFTPWSVIRVPECVDQVHWFRQRLDWPRGHDLVCDKSNRLCSTLIHEPAIVRVRHRYMDDLPAFRAKCFEVAEMAEAA